MKEKYVFYSRMETYKKNFFLFYIKSDEKDLNEGIFLEKNGDFLNMCEYFFFKFL